MNSLIRLAREGYDIEIKTVPETGALAVKLMKGKHSAISSIDGFDQIIACAYNEPDFVLYRVIDHLLDKYFKEETNDGHKT